MFRQPGGPGSEYRNAGYFGWRFRLRGVDVGGVSVVIVRVVCGSRGEMVLRGLFKGDQLWYCGGRRSGAVGDRNLFAPWR